MRTAILVPSSIASSKRYSDLAKPSIQQAVLALATSRIDSSIDCKREGYRALESKLSTRSDRSIPCSVQCIGGMITPS
ncbi:MAG: hypothetical protein NTV29_08300 [Planctomycetota bacterium]|nr:hypothetical protein [Planctomycetota bacterium]